MRVNGWALRALGGLVTAACGCVDIDDRQGASTVEDPTARAELPVSANPSSERRSPRAACNGPGRATPPVELCATTDVDENCDGVSTCTGDHLWSRVAIAGRVSPPDRLEPFEIAVAMGRRGDTFLGGTFTGTVDLGGGPLTSAGGGAPDDRDFAIARRGSNGALRWAGRYGGPGWQELRAIAPKGDDRLLVAGDFRGAIDLDGIKLSSQDPESFFVAELNGQGKPAWARPFTNEDYAFHMSHMSADDTGDIVVAGYVMGVFAFAGTQIRGDGSAVIKLSATGEPRWGHDTGLSADDGPIAMGIDAAGRIAMLEESGKSFRMTVVRLGKGGELLWRRRIRTTVDGMMIPTALAVWRTGEVLVVGRGDASAVVDPTLDMDLGPERLGCFAAKLDVAGALVWVRRFSGACFNAAAIDDAGQVVLGGALEGTETLGRATLSSDVRRPVLVKLDAAGKPIWGRLAAKGPGSGGVRALGLDTGGSATIGGVFTDRLDFGGGALPAGAEGAYFLGRLRP
ncbi:hypothetical protein [Polyangium aurulentum]|uniref:hypothetical protein n=1 Tax=Polyangium aurulentum TaxID=2567896 RepID=UPI0010ADD708|nr:hypothetical protein [Polyangium aurulentum]UQA57610.1 hypothetical protein E8A73_041075 [Polyangium aurulentum]